MKLFSVLFAAIFLAVSGQSPQEKYILEYRDIAVSEMQRTGVPASITLAQGMLESRYGLSPLAVEAHNHFGIKCHNDWEGGKYYQDDDRSNECFRVYRDASESFRDHSDFLRYRDRYKFLFDYEVTDYRSWAEGLKKAGYATDPQYPSKLINIIEEYRLYEYDVVEHGEAVEVPESPLQIEKPEILPVKYAKEYRFSLSREVYTQNGVPFVYSLAGETYESIAVSNRLFLKEILRFNDLEGIELLEPGTVVYLHAKRSKAPKGLDKYIVEEDGESLRDICQRFGLKKSSVVKLNRFDKDYVPRKGDTIRLR